MGTYFMLADLLTKGMTLKVFHEHTVHMGVYYYYDYYYFDGRFKLFERYFNIKFHVILLWIYLFFFHSY